MTVAGDDYRCLAMSLYYDGCAPRLLRDISNSSLILTCTHTTPTPTLRRRSEIRLATADGSIVRYFQSRVQVLGLKGDKNLELFPDCSIFRPNFAAQP